MKLGPDGAAGTSAPALVGGSKTRGRRGSLGGAEIRGTLRTGRRAVGTLLTLYVGGGDRAAAAFVAGRRIGGAVRRNRARRILREAWREMAPSTQGKWVVLVAREGIVNARTHQVEREIRELLRRALG